jgi:hypothetical protein
VIFDNQSDGISDHGFCHFAIIERVVVQKMPADLGLLGFHSFKLHQIVSDIVINQDRSV